MELKYVSRTRVLSGVIPFPNNAKRGFGTGRVVQEVGGKSAMLTIQQYDSRAKEFVSVAFAETCFSSIAEGDFVTFLRIEDVETNLYHTYVWKDEDVTVFIVNDNGKTIDRIQS